MKQRNEPDNYEGGVTVSALTADLVWRARPISFMDRVEAKVLSHVTFMPVLLLLRPVNNFLGQIIGNASEGNTIHLFIQGSAHLKMPDSGITLFSSKNSNKSQTFATGPYQRLHEARSRLVVWLWEPEYSRPSCC